MNENEARTLIECFAEKQQGGHFACPRCGKMAMDAESVTRNALSRRATVHICDACGTMEALEDMTGDRRPLTAWAIVSAPGEIPADYIGRRTVMIHAPIKGTVLLTEGYHFTVNDEEGRQYL